MRSNKKICDRCETIIVCSPISRSHTFHFDKVNKENSEVVSYDWVLCGNCQDALIKFVEGAFEGINPPDVTHVERELDQVEDHLSDIRNLIDSLKSERRTP